LSFAIAFSWSAGGRRFAAPSAAAERVLQPLVRQGRKQVFRSWPFSEARMPLPASNLRSNVGTWSVPPRHLPAVAHFLHDALPNEAWDPHFLGQELQTTYFDTASFHLRKARKRGDRYLTLRLRCYAAPDWEEAYAVSAKTESEKWRQEIPTPQAEAVLSGELGPTFLLPANLLARLQELTGDEPLVAVVKVCCRRYAVENAEDRYTLDVGVSADAGNRLPYSVLEYKSLDAEAVPPAAFRALRMRPMKLSKFLWATCP
jgi:hypothetical protein